MREVVVDLASEAGSRHDSYRREERHKPREHLADSHRANDEVARRIA